MPYEMRHLARKVARRWMQRQGDSYTPAQVPKSFYMVFELDPKHQDQLKQLASHKLEGVQGISDSHEIITRFFKDDRNAVLRMDGKKVEKLNDISRVMYDNPHYLMSEGLRAFKRVWNRNSWQIVEEILRIFIPRLATKSRGAMWRIGQALAEHQLKNAIADEYEYTESLREFSEWLHGTIKKLATKRGLDDLLSDINQVRPKDFQSHIAEIVVDQASSWKGEGEWFIKDDELVIPKGSRLYVKMWPQIMDKYKTWVKWGRFDVSVIPDWPPDFFEEVAPNQERRRAEMEWMMASNYFEEMDTILKTIDRYNLDSHYKITYIDAKKFKRIVGR